LVLALGLLLPCLARGGAVAEGPFQRCADSDERCVEQASVWRGSEHDALPDGTWSAKADAALRRAGGVQLRGSLSRWAGSSGLKRNGAELQLRWLQLERDGVAAAGAPPPVCQEASRLERARCHCTHGISLGAGGRHQLALRQFDSAIGDEPRLTRAWASRAEKYRSLGRMYEARRDYTAALSLRMSNGIFDNETPDTRTLQASLKEIDEATSRQSPIREEYESARKALRRTLLNDRITTLNVRDIANNLTAAVWRDLYLDEPAKRPPPPADCDETSAEAQRREEKALLQRVRTSSDQNLTDAADTPLDQLAIWPFALHLRGLSAFYRGRSAEAVHMLETATDLRGDVSLFWKNLAVAQLHVSEPRVFPASATATREALRAVYISKMLGDVEAALLVKDLQVWQRRSQFVGRHDRAALKNVESGNITAETVAADADALTKTLGTDLLMRPESNESSVKMLETLREIPFFKQIPEDDYSEVRRGTFDVVALASLIDWMCPDGTVDGCEQPSLAIRSSVADRFWPNPNARGNFSTLEDSYRERVAQAAQGLVRSLNPLAFRRILTLGESISYAYGAFRKKEWTDCAQGFGKSLNMVYLPQLRAKLHYYRGLCLSYGGGDNSTADLAGALVEFDLAVRLQPYVTNYVLSRAAVKSMVSEKSKESIADYSRGITLRKIFWGMQAVNITVAPNATDAAASATAKKAPVPASSEPISAENSKLEVTAYQLYREQKWELAAVAYGKAIDARACAKISDCYNERGLCYDKLRHFRKAHDDFDHAVQHSPGVGLYWLNRGISHHNLGELKSAKDDYKQAVKLGEKSANKHLKSVERELALAEVPAAARAAYDRARELLDQGDRDAAVQMFTQALDQGHPDRALCFNQRGLAQREEQAALRDFDRAIQLRPDIALYYYNRGVSFENMNDLHRAAEDFRKAVNLGYGETAVRSLRDVESGMSYSGTQFWVSALLASGMTIAFCVYSCIWTQQHLRDRDKQKSRKMKAQSIARTQRKKEEAATGLIFSTDILEMALDDAGVALNERQQVYLAAVLETLAAEMWRTAGAAAKVDGKKAISPEHLCTGIVGDADLASVLSFDPLRGVEALLSADIRVLSRTSDTRNRGSREVERMLRGDRAAPAWQTLLGSTTVVVQFDTAQIVKSIHPHLKQQEATCSMINAQLSRYLRQLRFGTAHRVFDTVAGWIGSNQHVLPMYDFLVEPLGARGGRIRLAAESKSLQTLNALLNVGNNAEEELIRKRREQKELADKQRKEREQRKEQTEQSDKIRKEQEKKQHKVKQAEREKKQKDADQRRERTADQRRKQEEASAIRVEAEKNRKVQEERLLRTEIDAQHEREVVEAARRAERNAAAAQEETRRKAEADVELRKQEAAHREDERRMEKLRRAEEAARQKAEHKRAQERARAEQQAEEEALARTFSANGNAGALDDADDDPLSWMEQEMAQLVDDDFENEEAAAEPSILAFLSGLGLSKHVETFTNAEVDFETLCLFAVKDFEGLKIPHGPRVRIQRATEAILQSAQKSHEPAEGGQVSVPDEFLDPITQLVMTDPVTTLAGNTFDRQSIARWLERHDTDPLHGVTLPQKTLIPNNHLRSQISQWKSKNRAAAARAAALERPKF